MITSKNPWLMLSTEDLQESLHHWIRTPANAYLGSDYGGKDVITAEIIHPHTHIAAERVLHRLRNDWPKLGLRVSAVSWTHRMDDIQLAFHFFDGETVSVSARLPIDRKQGS